MDAYKLLKRPFVDLPALASNMQNIDETKRQLEAISERAGMMAAYLEERHGYGCGDQGHETAIKSMNRAGKNIHCKVFGYNAFHELSF